MIRVFFFPVSIETVQAALVIIENDVDCKHISMGRRLTAFFTKTDFRLAAIDKPFSKTLWILRATEAAENRNRFLEHVW